MVGTSIKYYPPPLVFRILRFPYAKFCLDAMPDFIKSISGHISIIKLKINKELPMKKLTKREKKLFAAGCRTGARSANRKTHRKSARRYY